MPIHDSAGDIFICLLSSLSSCSMFCNSIFSFMMLICASNAVILISRVVSVCLSGGPDVCFAALHIPVSGSVVASFSLSIWMVFWYSLQQFSSLIISDLQNASCFSVSDSWKLSCFFCLFFGILASVLVFVFCVVVVLLFVSAVCCSCSFVAFLEFPVVRLHNASVVIFSVVCGGVIVEGGGDGGVMSGVLSCVGGTVICGVLLCVGGSAMSGVLCGCGGVMSGVLCVGGGVMSGVLCVGGGVMGGVLCVGGGVMSGVLLCVGGSVVSGVFCVDGGVMSGVLCVGGGVMSSVLLCVGGGVTSGVLLCVGGGIMCGVLSCVGGGAMCGCGAVRWWQCNVWRVAVVVH